MITLNEWIELLTIILIWGCIISWVIIWIKMWICRKTGKCPKDRICKTQFVKIEHGAGNTKGLQIYTNMPEKCREKRDSMRGINSIDLSDFQG